MKFQFYRFIPLSKLADRFWLILLVLSAIFAVGRTAVYAQVEVNRSIDVQGKKYYTPQTRVTVKRGLKFLAERQHPDGSFGSGSTFKTNVAVTALCGMAFLADGNTPGRGKYGLQVQKAVDFILASCKPSGYIISPDSISHGPMYGHGFATLFLAEVYGMTRSKDVRVKLEKAVELIVKSQNSKGGWRYTPESKDADLSVTVCQIMALRAARNCGIFVSKDVIDRCIDYVKKSQNPDGGFRYQLVRQAVSEFPRSAAGVVALYSAGIYEGAEIQNGLSYLMRHLPNQRYFRGSHFFYGQYYAVQAMWQAGGQYWGRWYPAIREELISGQMTSGGWRPDSSNCIEYSTAMSCIVLQIPRNNIPIFQR
ncbi:prenyltransferase/squalene oxidase repeat-containing protein [Gimesia aquarii]|uniref:Prenyltransferase and squalene oxidase repeat protein n=1 Tax=Gimesia aquarii TaxID=2527964 RepID=A0A517WYW8_9PLAN|nr:prenyltransferase/squalene oxidase repeat-containing protein [Gimesia aquarii]QDU10447.1 Prenyltransferase and squalene oxidase repeat protein [Gimesia aquarii]